MCVYVCSKKHAQPLLLSKCIGQSRMRCQIKIHQMLIDKLNFVCSCLSPILITLGVSRCLAATVFLIIYEKKLYILQNYKIRIINRMFTIFSRFRVFFCKSHAWRIPWRFYIQHNINLVLSLSKLSLMDWWPIHTRSIRHQTRCNELISE